MPSLLTLTRLNETREDPNSPAVKAEALRGIVRQQFRMLRQSFMRAQRIVNGPDKDAIIAALGEDAVEVEAILRKTKAHLEQLKPGATDEAAK